jgi:hypothetical protein
LPCDLVVGWFLYNNMTANLAAINRSSGGALSWNFLGQTAGFAISEGPAFRPEESYWRAYIVGMPTPCASASSASSWPPCWARSPALRASPTTGCSASIAMVYVEIIPQHAAAGAVALLVFRRDCRAAHIQRGRAARRLGYLSNRGMYVTLALFDRHRDALALVAAWAAWSRAWRGVAAPRQQARQGLPASGFLVGIVIFAAVALIGFWASASSQAQMPANTAYELRRGDRGTLFADANANGAYIPGVDTPLAYVPITLLDADGQVVATGAHRRRRRIPLHGFARPKRDPHHLGNAAAAFCQRAGAPGLQLPRRPGADAGICRAAAGAGRSTPAPSSPRSCAPASTPCRKASGRPAGPWACAPNATLRMIVLPQALRVIIPPLTSQYLNLVKNSSLAIAIGYPRPVLRGRASSSTSRAPRCR